MILFILINSIILFILMQILGVPLSNLTVLKFEYDTFAFSKDKTTVGMNIIYNMFLANIYILLVYEVINDNQMKKHVYLTVCGYLFIRYIYILLVLNRLKLLNLKYESTLIMLTLFSTYIVHKYIISENISIRIPIEEFKNELVLLAIIFLYTVFKKSLIINFSNRNNTSNREKYIRHTYLNLFDKLNPIITCEIDKLDFLHGGAIKEKQDFKLLNYSFIIYENFSRPKCYRILENNLAKISKKEMSTGLMQVRSEVVLSDKESIELAIPILFDSFLNYYYSDESKYGDYWIDEICHQYNPQEGNDYRNEVKFIFFELRKITLSS